MFITELAEPTLLVVYPGRFQPFHKGHHAVYEYLTGKFGRNNVIIATSNKTDNAKSPFTFSEKAYFMQLTGVPADRIVQATNPYQIESILSTSNITVSDPDNTVVIFAVSEKDMAEDPRFSFKTKKDGSAPYFQPLKNIQDTQSMKQHGYIMTVPTFDFTVLGQPMRSASELRKLYSTSDEKTRQGIIKDLFGRYTNEAEQIMSSKIPSETEPVSENFNRGGNNPLRDRNDYYQKLDYLQKQLMDPALRDMRDQINDRIGQLQKAARMAGFISETMDEGWSNKHNPTPYGVYINGRQWKEFKTDDHARAVAEKLQARLKAEGRTDKVTFAPAEGWLKNENRGGNYEQLRYRKNSNDRYVLLDRTLDSVILTTNDFKQARQEAIEWADYDDIVTQVVDKTTGKTLFQVDGNSDAMNYLDECGGTGVIASKKQARDPRYSNSLTKDVRPGQIQKNLRAFKLAEEREPYQQAIDKLTVQWIERMSAEIDEIKARIGTEQLPAQYKEKLKQRIEQLKAERDKLLFKP